MFVYIKRGNIADVVASAEHGNENAEKRRMTEGGSDDVGGIERMRKHKDERNQKENNEGRGGP